jgi:CheY-like chemotaxis protein
LRDRLWGAFRTLSVAAEKKGLEIVCDVCPALPDLLLGDPDRLQQILVNLVGNAIKFTDRGEVAIRVFEESHDQDRIALHFTVADRGIGISPERQQQIFQPFIQADSSTTRKYGGTGLGLTICRQLVEMMGGRIWVESELGNGSTFHFIANFGQSSTKPVSEKNLRSAVQSVLSNEKNNHPIQNLAIASSPAGSRAALRIFLGEDNRINQDVAVKLLAKSGHSVVAANNGKEVLAAHKSERFDLIIMDVQMPEMGGFEATALIREREKATGEHIPIIAVTANAMKGDREKCINAGMDGYVSKPIRAQQLLETVAEFGNSATSREESLTESPLTGASDIIDGQILLDGFSGDEELLRSVASLFFTEVPTQLADLRLAVEKRDAESLVRLAHKIRGSVGIFSRKVAEGPPLRLETLGRQGEFSAAWAAYDELAKNIGHLTEELHAMLSKDTYSVL